MHYVSNRLYIKDKPENEDLIKRFVEKCTFYKVPLFKNQVNDPGWSSTERFYGCSEGWYVFPRGMTRHLDDSHFSVNVKSVPAKYKLSGKIKLGAPGYEHQPGAVKTFYEKLISLKNKVGILCSPCGTGKTIMGGFLIKMLSQKTLILVDQDFLLSQWEESLESIFSGINIQKNTLDSVGNIDVFTIQHFLQKDKMADYNRYGLVIVDETHIVPALRFSSVVSMLSPKFLVGLSATPFRDDGKTSMLHDFMGSILYRVENASLMIPDVNMIATGEDYSDTKIFIFRNKKAAASQYRNKLITHYAVNDVAGGRKILVLTTTVKHCETLKKYFDNAGLRSCVLHSKGVRKNPLKRITKSTNLELRTKGEIIEDFNNGVFDIIIATQIADKGMDVPLIDAAYLTIETDAKSKLEQRIGRALRKKKHAPIIRDFWDADMIKKVSRNPFKNFRCFKSDKAKSRARYYTENMNWPVKWTMTRKMVDLIDRVKKGELRQWIESKLKKKSQKSKP